MLFQAAEVVVSRGGMLPGARRVLELFADSPLRCVDRFQAGHTDEVDSALRAFVLLARHQGAPATAEAFLRIEAEPSQPSATASRDEREQFRKVKERLEEARAYVKQLLPFYVARGALLVDGNAGAGALESMASAIGTYGSLDYRFRNDHDRQQMRLRFRQTVSETTFVDKQLVVELVGLGTTDSDKAHLMDRDISTLDAFALHGDARIHVLAVALKQAQEIERARQPASDKAARLVDIARLSMHISSSEASAFFGRAVESLQDVDYDVRHELEMFGPFVKRATASGMSVDQRRAVASNLVDVAARTWIFVGESDSIPWATLVEALVRLDVPVALAAISRWADEGIASLPSTLSAALRTGATTGTIDSSTVAALGYLAGDLDAGVLQPLLQRLCTTQHHERGLVLEELARIAVMNVDGKGGVEQVRQVSEAGPAYGTHWLTRAAELAAFESAAVPVQQDSDIEGERPTVWTGVDSEVLEVTSLERSPFSTLKEIREALQTHVGARSASGSNAPHVSVGAVLDAMRNQVSVADRRMHLEALEQLHLRNRYAVVDAIVKAVLAWAPQSLAVRAWCVERLPSVLVQRFPTFIDWLTYEYGTESRFLDVSGVSKAVFAASILEGLEAHAADCDAAKIYRALGVVADLIGPEEAWAVISYHLAERALDIDEGYLRLDLADVPGEVDAATGRLLNACFGDIELSVRWQAAHALRACARMMKNGVVAAVFGLWHNTAERSFRMPNGPFYWGAARLWQMLAAARIARECPTAVSPHQQLLIGVLKDADYPHVLVRNYAREALLALQERGAVNLTAEQQGVVAAVNTSKVPHARSSKRTERGFDGFASQDDFRFHFDSTDTLPYWYDNALRPFSKVSARTFREKAEKWIIDRWGAQPGVWKWLHEPRKYRFERNRLDTSHRHGSLPAVERYSTHVEWHAMFCVVGELLETEALVKIKPGEYESFGYFLARHQLTEGPWWLSDFRQPKPLEQFLWLESSDEEHSDKEWLASVDEARMLQYLGRPDSFDLPVAANEHGIRGHQRWSIEVASALVEPTTAAALLRSLQGAKSSWDYALPGVGHTDDIDVPPFVFKEWIAYPSRDVELDQHDPMRRQVRGRQAVPGKRMRAWLELPLKCDDELRWTGPNPDYTCTYRCWSDERTEADRYSEAEGAAGYRLLLSRVGLQRVMDRSKLDLLVEITFKRRTREYSLDDDDQEKEPTEAEYDFVVLLRRDGSIESARGPVGLWRAPNTRAGSE